MHLTKPHPHTLNLPFKKRLLRLLNMGQPIQTQLQPTSNSSSTRPPILTFLCRVSMVLTFAKLYTMIIYLVRLKISGAVNSSEVVPFDFENAETILISKTM